MTIRLHWISVFARMYSRRMVIMFTVWVVATFCISPQWSTLQGLFMIGVVWHTCFVFYCVLAWRMETLELFPKHFALRSGVIVKEGKTIGYDSIVDSQVIESLIGRMLGYGTVVLVLESREGTKRIAIPYLPYMAYSSLVPLTERSCNER